MANAEKLLNEAQYAFQNIGYDDSSESRKYRSRATRLARKILRKYPGTTEAASAHSLLLRLDEEGYATTTKNVHTHSSGVESKHNHYKLRTPIMQDSNTGGADLGSDVQLRWGDLLARIFSLPRPVLAVFFIVGMFLFGLFGPFILVPIVVLVLLASPLKSVFPNKTQRSSEDAIQKINAWLAEERKRKVTRQ